MASGKLWALIVVMLAVGILAEAQTNVNEEQGLKPYDSWHGGDLDSISMTNGALTLHIPLVSYPQRGNLDLSFTAYSNTKQWVLVPTCFNDPINGGQTCNWQWKPLPRGGQLQKFGQPVVDGVYIASSVDYWLQNACDAEPPDPDTGQNAYDWTYAVVAPDGNGHSLGDGIATSCQGFPLRTLDATGMIQSDANTVIMPNGTRYSYQGGQAVSIESRAPGSVTDANGNQISISSAGAFTDTLNRAIPNPGGVTADLSSCPAGTSSAKTWTVPGLSGVNRVFKFCYSIVSIYSSFNDGNDYPTTNTSLLTAIVLPDLTAWTFAYDHWGDVTRLGFPTGGSISYEYQLGSGLTGQSLVTTSRTVDANDGTGGHRWTYTYTWNGPPANYGTVVVAAPDGNETVHTITAPVSGAGSSLYDTQVQYYQGSHTNGTLLKTVATQYTGIANPVDGLLTGGTAANVVPSQIATTYADGHSSRVANVWDSGNIETISPGFSQPYTVPIVFGSLLQRDEYDFSNTLARSTVNHYLWQDNSAYKSNNFIGLQVSSMLKDGAGCEMAKTSNGYDETYNSITLQASGITTQHGSAPWPVRGNHTSSSRWLISTCAEQSAITSHTIPYDTGLPYQSYDPLGHFTQYTYSSSFAGAYLTQTNLPDTQMPDTGAPVVHHIIGGNYDFNTGLLTSFTDENGQPYTYSYESLMLRLSEGDHPDGGKTLFTYPDTLTVTRQRLITATPSAVYDSYTAKFDGLGRPVQTKQVIPSGTVLTDTTYDVVGRVASVSNPYYQGSNHSTDPTYGITSTQYDALSRVTRTTKQDGSFTTVTYNGICTIATDEAGKARKSCADALGRMTTVYEDPSGLNYETDYQYDVLNNLLRVDQKGSAPTDNSQWRTRLFTYDSLSRIITAFNPEAGTTCYGYWSGGNCINGYDNNGNLLKKTDARNITITYAYDALNRLLDKTYSDGTQNESHRYDYASFLGQTFAYPTGREVAATAANSTIQSFNSYDPMGRVASTTQCNPGVTGCKTFAASYDKLGNLTSLAYPGNGFTVTYSYDTNVPNSAGKLTGATDSNGATYASLDPTSPNSYLPSGAIKEFTSPNFNGNKYHVDYNNRLQPTEIWTGTSAGTGALFDKQYSYGATGTNNGNIYTITNIKDTTRTQSFSYDALNRLITAGDQTHWSNSYVYDAWGNLYQKNPGTLPGEGMSAVPDVNNHLSGLAYDAAGNVQNDGGSRYAYDAENRIICTNPDVNFVCNTNSVIYTYDADGRRIQKSTGVNYWYGPSGAVLAETDSSGTWTNYIFFGGQRLARNVNGDIKYYVTDHLHSTGMFVDKAGTTGAILDDNDFYPWGGIVPGVGKTTSNNTIKFTGQYRDTDTAANLDYFGARYYSNTIGRFMSPDWAAKPTTVPYAKFGDPQSLNLYSYVENGPVNRVDTDGHYWAGMNGLNCDLSGAFSAPGMAMGSGPDGDGVVESATERNLQSVPPPAPPPPPGLPTTVPSVNLPGPQYKTADQAAKAAIRSTNRTAVREKKEIAGRLVKNANGSFSTTRGPESGRTATSADPGDVPAGTINAGIWHDHTPVPHARSEQFSDSKVDPLHLPGDKDLAREERVPIYVGTPSGIIRKYDPQTDRDTIIGTTPH